jgi:hypothetical protein
MDNILLKQHDITSLLFVAKKFIPLSPLDNEFFEVLKRKLHKALDTHETYAT